MREAIGGGRIYIIAIGIILLFTGYLAFSINRSRVYNVKNKIVNILERYNGNSENARIAINDYLASVSYRSTGNCPSGYGYSINGTGITSSNAMYCINEIVVTDESAVDSIPKSYFEVTTFFKLDIPIISSVFNFQIKGQTKTLFRPSKY